MAACVKSYTGKLQIVKHSFMWYSLAILLSLTALFGCSEFIDLETEDPGGQLIVYGHLSNGNVGNIVTVSRTGDLGSAPVPVMDARVTISNARGQSERLLPVPRQEGVYELPGNVLVRESGEQFALEVVVDGEVYRTELKEMPEDIGEDILSFEVTTNTSISMQGATVREDVMNVFARTEFQELPASFYLRWEIEEAYTYLGAILPLNYFPGGQIQCFVVNELNNQAIFLHNGELNRATTIPERLFVSRPIDKSFQALHYFNLIRSSLTRESYDYWSKIEAIANRQGTIFDRPVAPVPGNIFADSGEEAVLGFFDVVALDTTRLAITHNDVPRFFVDNCDTRGEKFRELFTVPRFCVQCLIDEGILDAECLRCNVLPGSSGRRPNYF